MIVSLTEEAEAINWYEQRISLEKDKSARAIMQNAQKEEFKHFSMDLEWLLRAKPVRREIAQGILFTKGNIVSEGEEAEEKADQASFSSFVNYLLLGLERLNQPFEARIAAQRIPLRE